MARIDVSRHIERPIADVWAAIADLGTHPVWMRDARSLEFTTEQRTGVGTRMEVETRVGPLRTTDVMEVVGWDDGRSIEVVHEGVVSGRGVLATVPEGSGTLVTWQEALHFPWWLGDGFTALLARPVLSRIWAGNLKRLEESINSP